jgi:predicted  nucleic acid-binding Zn-ribbon protein
MLDVIEKLLVLQDRDRKIRRVRTELSGIEPQRHSMKEKAAGAKAGVERAKQRGNEIETKRKQLELEVESKKGLIEKYGHQQFQTKKNDEYQALAKEIVMCKEAITRIEDQEIELMEQGEQAAKELAEAARALKEALALVDREVAALNASEENLRKDLEKLESNRHELAAALDESVLGRYERIMKSRGDSAVVGIEHSVCGGCHMKLPAQSVLHCRAQTELTTCNNCGRILYYQAGMDLSVAE